MTLSHIMWAICGVVWAVLILGTIGLVIFNRIRNGKGKDNR